MNSSKNKFYSFFIKKMKKLALKCLIVNCVVMLLIELTYRFI